jgi:amino-acid N-acetyltransferase
VNRVSEQIVVRPATLNDVDGLFDLINFYVPDGIMLYRSKETLATNIATFVVATDNERVIGCGSLSRLGTDLIEIRSLGVYPEYKAKGIGGLLVDQLEIAAKQTGVPKLMALTYATNFFQRKGFSIVEKEIFPEKVWLDCSTCAKKDRCDEIAVVKEIG